MLGQEALAMELVIQATERLGGFADTTAELETLKSKVRTITGQITRHFKSMYLKVSRSLSRFKESLVKIENAVVSFANKVKWAFTIVVATTALIGRELVKAGSQAEAMGSLFVKVFEDMADETRQWAKDYSQNVGVSFYKTIQQLTNIQNLLTGFGMPVAEAQRFSKSLVQIGNDLSSSLGKPAEEVLLALQSGLLGETEAVKKLGIDLTETALKQEALTRGVKDFGPQTSRTLKMLIAYSAVLSQSRKLLGNKVDTYKEFFNQLERTKGKLHDLKVEISEGLLPVLNDMLFKINKLDFSEFVTSELVAKIGKMTVGFLAVTGSILAFSLALRIVLKTVNFAIISFQIVAGVIHGFGVAVGAVMSTLAVLKGMLAGLIALVSGLSLAFVLKGVMIIGAITLIITAIDKLVTSTGILGDGWGTVFTKMADLAVGFALNTAEAFFTLNKIMNTFLKNTAIFGKWGTRALFGTKVFDPIFDNAGKGAEGGIEHYEAQIQTIRDMKDQYQKNGLKGVLDKGKEEIQGILKDITAELGTSFGEIFNKLASSVGVQLEKIGDTSFTALKKVVDDLVAKHGKEFKIKSEKIDELQDLIDYYAKMEEEAKKASKAGGFSFNNLSFQDQLKRIKELGAVMGDSQQEILEEIANQYKNKINDIMLNSEDIDYRYVAILKDELNKVNIELEKLKDQKLSDIIKKSLNFNPQDIEGSMAKFIDGQIFDQLDDKLLNTYSGATENILKGLMAEVDKIVLTGDLEKDTEILNEFIERYRKEIGYTTEETRAMIQATTDLGNSFTKLGDYLESDFLIAMGGVTALLTELPTYAGMMGAGGMFGGLADFFGGETFTSIVGGIGMTTAVIGIGKTLSDYLSSGDDERNRAEIEKFEEQNTILKSQTEVLESINDSIGTIYTGLISNLANVPTLSNITEGANIFNSIYDSVRKGVNIGNLSYVEEYKKKSFWKTRRKYKTKTLSDEGLYDLLGLGYSGRIEDLGLGELKVLSQVLGQIDAKSIERLVSGGDSSFLGAIVKSAMTQVGASMLVGGPWGVIAGGVANLLSGNFKDMFESFGDMLPDWGQNIWGFSSWNFRRIKDENSNELKAQIDAYISVLEKLITLQAKVFKEATLEGFEGVNVLEANDLKAQYEDFYKELGLDPKDYSDDIAKMVEANKVLITATEDVRSAFIETFTAGGASMGEALSTSFESYIQKIENNVAQVIYDTYADAVDTEATNLFENLSNALVNIKATGGDIFKYINDFFSKDSNELEGLLTAIRELQDAEKTFDSITNDIRDGLAGLGAEPVEVLAILSPETIEDMKNNLSSAMSNALEEADFTVFTQSLGEGIYNSVKDYLVKAFVESAKYQELINKFFDMDAINDSLENAVDFREAYNIISAELENIKTRLEAEGLAFDKTDATTSDQQYTNGAQAPVNSSGEWGYTDYGSAQVIKEFNITVTGNTVYGDSDTIKEFVTQIREEIKRQEELES